MGLVRAGDEHGVDVAAPDGLKWVGGDIGGAEIVRHRPGALRGGVADDVQARPRQIPGDDPGMVGAHDAGADDGYSDRHSISLIYEVPIGAATGRHRRRRQR